MNLKQTTVKTLIAMLLIAACDNSFVFAEEDYQLARKLRQQGEILPLEKIVALAKAKKNGEVIEAELERKNGYYLYEVEILDVKGQVWELKINAKTGKILEVELDD